MINWTRYSPNSYVNSWVSPNTLKCREAKILLYFNHPWVRHSESRYLSICWETHLRFVRNGLFRPKENVTWESACFDLTCTVKTRGFIWTSLYAGNSFKPRIPELPYPEPQVCLDGPAVLCVWCVCAFFVPLAWVLYRFVFLYTICFP